jgi:hypothetical protein
MPKSWAFLPAITDVSYPKIQPPIQTIAVVNAKYQVGFGGFGNVCIGWSWAVGTFLKSSPSLEALSTSLTTGSLFSELPDLLLSVDNLRNKLENIVDISC